MLSYSEFYQNAVWWKNAFKSCFWVWKPSVQSLSKGSALKFSSSISNTLWLLVLVFFLLSSFFVPLGPFSSFSFPRCVCTQHHKLDPCQGAYTPLLCIFLGKFWVLLEAVEQSLLQYWSGLWHQTSQIPASQLPRKLPWECAPTPFHLQLHSDFGFFHEGIFLARNLHLIFGIQVWILQSQHQASQENV